MKQPSQSYKDYADINRITDLCAEYVDLVFKQECDDALDDIKHYIFEEAMEYCYGKDVWPLLNGIRQGKIDPNAESDER